MWWTNQSVQKSPRIPAFRLCHRFCWFLLVRYMGRIESQRQSRKLEKLTCWPEKTCVPTPLMSANMAMIAVVTCGLQTPSSSLQCRLTAGPLWRPLHTFIQLWTRIMLLFQFIISILVSFMESFLGSLHLQCADSNCGLPRKQLRKLVQPNRLVNSF